MSAAALDGASLLDASLGVGYQGTGEDWSHAKSSERKDRPLTNEQLKVLTAKSNAAGLRQLGLQYLEMSCAAALIAFSSSVPGAAGAVLRLAGTLLLGFGLVTMGHCAQHECIHNTAFASRRLNALVAWLVSLPRLTNPRWERMLHKDHHTYTNDPTRDPEIMAGEPANSMPGDLWAYATKILRIGGGKFGLGVYSARLAILLSGSRGHVVGYSGFDPVPGPKAAAVRDSLASSCRAQLAFYAAVAAGLTLVPGGWSAAVKYWLLPLMVGEPLHAFFHIADHLNTEQDHTNGRSNTRTTVAPKFVAFNLWNMNYHAEHHLYPSIPFHHLPAAHAALSGHFDRTSPSAVDMHRQLLTRWMPHFQHRLRKQGIPGVQGAGWQPCTPDRA